jgi:hypothetical protein
MFEFQNKQLFVFFKVCRNALWLSTGSREGFGAANTGAANGTRTRQDHGAPTQRRGVKAAQVRAAIGASRARR